MNVTTTLKRPGKPSGDHSTEFVAEDDDPYGG